MYEVIEEENVRYIRLASENILQRGRVQQSISIPNILSIMWFRQRFKRPNMPQCT